MLRFTAMLVLAAPLFGGGFSLKWDRLRRVRTRRLRMRHWWFAPSAVTNRRKRRFRVSLYEWWMVANKPPL